MSVSDIEAKTCYACDCREIYCELVGDEDRQRGLNGRWQINSRTKERENVPASIVSCMRFRSAAEESLKVAEFIRGSVPYFSESVKAEATPLKYDAPLPTG